MQLKKMLLVAASMLVFSGSALIAADFDWMASLNLRSDSDPYGYKSGLASRFRTPETQLSLILKSVGAPADAYMVSRLAELSGRPPEYVLKQYQGKFNLNMKLYKISDFGGWDQAYKKYFEDGALFDKIYTNQ